MTAKGLQMGDSYRAADDSYRAADDSYRAADDSALTKSTLVNMKFCRATKPDTSWKFFTHPPPNYHPSKEVRYGSVIILVLK